MGTKQPIKPAAPMQAELPAPLPASLEDIGVKLNLLDLALNGLAERLEDHSDWDEDFRPVLDLVGEIQVDVYKLQHRGCETKPAPAPAE